MDGEFEYFVGGIGTGGSITGIGRKLKEVYPDASHICYAYRWCNCNNLDLFNNPEIIEYYTDDGEPSSTAGKPIANVLKKYSHG